MSFWELSRCLGEQIRDFGGSRRQAEILMDSGTSPGGSKIKIIRSREGKSTSPGHTPASFRLVGGVRIQHTGYYMQGCRTHRTHRIQDEGHIGCRRNTPQAPNSLVAPGGPADIYMYITVYMINVYNIYPWSKGSRARECRAQCK